MAEPLRLLCFDLDDTLWPVRPVIIPSDRLEELTSHLMLFYTGIKRTADKVAGSYVPTLESKRRQLRILRDMVEEALSILCAVSFVKR